METVDTSESITRGTTTQKILWLLLAVVVAGSLAATFGKI